jgi:membrane protease YdiL (CAAX protease family)
LSGPLWVVLMFCAALLFAYLRKSSGSLGPAIVAHVFFNLVMNLTIFGFLWV